MHERSKKLGYEAQDVERPDYRPEWLAARDEVAAICRNPERATVALSMAVLVRRANDSTSASDAQAWIAEAIMKWRDAGGPDNEIPALIAMSETRPVVEILRERAERAPGPDLDPMDVAAEVKAAESLLAAIDEGRPDVAGSRSPVAVERAHSLIDELRTIAARLEDLSLSDDARRGLERRVEVLWLSGSPERAKLNAFLHLVHDSANELEEATTPVNDPDAPGWKPADRAGELDRAIATVVTEFVRQYGEEQFGETPFDVAALRGAIDLLLDESPGRRKKGSSGEQRPSKWDLLARAIDGTSFKCDAGQIQNAYRAHFPRTKPKI